MIEHLTTGEEKNGDQADRSPEIAVLDDRKQVGGEDRAEGYDPHQNRNGRDNAHVVDGSNQRRLSSLGQMTTNPLVELFGGHWAAG